MRTVFFVATTVGGSLLLLFLLRSYGVDAVGADVADLGWGAVWVCALRVVQISGAGLAWSRLLPRAAGVPLRRFLMLRWMRESINALLPVAQIGGELVGARLLTFAGVEGGLAGASVLVDVLTQASTQFVFALVGFALLVHAGGDASLVRWIGIGLAVMGPALGAFFLVQRFGGFKLIERALMRLAADPKWASLGKVANLNQRIQEIYRRRRRLLTAFAIHLAVWFVGVFEIHIALAYMGFPVSYAQALIIESLGHAVRGAAFAVPGALGVQEGGFILLCALFGIPAPAALALSLVKRLPELVFGIPGLFAWQALEGRRLFRTRAARPLAAELAAEEAR